MTGTPMGGFLGEVIRDARPRPAHRAGEDVSFGREARAVGPGIDHTIGPGLPAPGTGADVREVRQPGPRDKRTMPSGVVGPSPPPVRNPAVVSTPGEKAKVKEPGFPVVRQAAAEEEGVSKLWQRERRESVFATREDISHESSRITAESETEQRNTADGQSTVRTRLEIPTKDSALRSQEVGDSGKVRGIPIDPVSPDVSARNEVEVANSRTEAVSRLGRQVRPRTMGPSGTITPTPATPAGGTPTPAAALADSDAPRRGGASPPAVAAGITAPLPEPIIAGPTPTVVPPEPTVPAPAAPRVHIGHLEIVVEASETPPSRQAPPAPAPSGDFTSRRYLRGV